MTIAVLGITFLYRNTLNDTWTERLTEESEVECYLEFYTAGEKAITAEKGTFIINNKSDQEMRTGEFYALQKKVLGKWSDVEPYLDFVMVAYEVPAGEYSFTVNWGKDYGKLPHGTYRIIKDCSVTLDAEYHKSEDLVFACEFRI
ncbi:hypothetical protein D1151_00215 [Emergencia sp. 1XD21-10]|nr:hypothetical protein [Emergencia sp. 1XD21-10]